MPVVLQAIAIGLLIAMAGTIPRNLLFLANTRFHPEWPWAVPLVALYLWAFWCYLNGKGPPQSTREARRVGLRAHALPLRLWCWCLVSGGLAIAALVAGLQVLNFLVALPVQRAPELQALPPLTAIALLIVAAPFAGVVEEAAFRGYMQGPIEAEHGLLVAILVTGTAFALAHLDFTPVLWPYYVAVSAIYGAVTHFARSILPAVLLHTAGNLYSNFDLWFTGGAEWQAATQAAPSIWQVGAPPEFWWRVGALLVLGMLGLGAFRKLAGVARIVRGPAARAGL